MSLSNLTTNAHSERTQRASPQIGDPRAELLAGLPVTERGIEIAGIPTAVLEGGDGPPVLLLHGPGEHATKWFRVIPSLVRKHRVIAPDLPGHGASAPVEAPVESARVLAWLDELIARTCATPPVIVGQILGGAIAARFAAVNPERLCRLVLCDSLGLAPFRPAPEFGATLMAFITEPGEETHDRLWQHCAYDLDALINRMGEGWDRLRAYNLDRARVAGLKPTQQALMEQFGVPAIPAEELARIVVPTVLIWGRHDLATPLSVAEAASARHGWPLHIIENAADDPPVEQPERFLEALGAALEDAAGAVPAGERMGIETREAWDRIAPGYDRNVTDTHLQLAEQALRSAGVRPGTRFLDVAAGSGALALTAARMGADVFAIDHSPVMLRLLDERARREGLAVRSQVMDGQALGFADGSFDLAGSQFGVMLFPDMPAGIREMARVVRPGGRVLVIAYADPRRIEFLGSFTRAVQSVRPSFEGPPMDPPPLPLQLADPGRLRSELAAAGLTDVAVDEVAERTEYRTGDELWGWLVGSNPIVEAMLSGLELTDAERRSVRQALDRIVRDKAGPSGAAVLASPVNIGIGTR